MNNQCLPKCIQNNPVFFVCINPICKNIPYICSQLKTCDCCLKHSGCPKTDWIFIIQHLNSKIQNKPKQFIQFINQIQQLFQRQKKIIQINQITFKNWKQNYGLNQKQKIFYSKIQGGRHNQINSKMIQEIIESIKNREDLQFKQKKQIQSYVDQIIEMTSTIGSKIQKLYKQSFKQRKKGNSISKQIIKKVKSVQYLKKNRNKHVPIQKIQKSIQFFFQNKIKSLNLLYKASNYNYSVQQFWKKCQHKTQTLVLIKTQFDKIIGAFTPIAWNSQIDGFTSDHKRQTFLFSITQNEKIQCIPGRQSRMVGHNRKYGPIFGGGFDLAICDKANIECTSHSRIGESYGNDKYKYEDEQSNVRFSGAESGFFKIIQWEVYKINWQNI